MSKNFSILLQRVKSGNKPQHKVPPRFDREKYSLVKSPLLQYSETLPQDLHKKPPPFKRTQETRLLDHKTPPPFLRTLFKSDENERKSSPHRKPPIFTKASSPVRTSESLLNKIKSSGTWSVTDALSEDKDRSMVLESSNEFTPGFELIRSKGSFGLQSMNSMNDSVRIKDEMKRFEPSASIESAIMHLNPEITPFAYYKEEEFSHRDICNYQSSESDYSSNGSGPPVPVVVPIQKFRAFLPAAPQVIVHKKPPVFNRKNHENLKSAATIESDLSKSESLSPFSSVSNSPGSKLRVFEPPLTENSLFESPNTPTSGVSENLREKSTKNLLKLKSSFLLENSMMDKTKNYSPFVSNNGFEKAFSIPMKPINYYDRSEENTSLKFDNRIPEVPNEEKLEFSYPSVRNGARGSSITIFIQSSELPDNIKHYVYLNQPVKHQEKQSKYTLKKPLTNKELDIMAKMLAEDLANREIGYYS